MAHSTGPDPPAISLIPLDSLAVDVLTDDVSDNYVSKTLFAVSEFANVIRGGATVISGEVLLCANLGFGLRLVSEVGGVRHTLLFDTGPEGAIFIRNCANLGVPLGEVEAIAVSHGHWDHMAALPAAIDEIVGRGGRVTVHVNPGMFDERAIRLQSGRIVPVAKVPMPEELESHGATVVNSSEARLLLEGNFYYSGEIPRVTAFEKGRDDHLCRRRPEAPWQPDPLLMDERMLVARVRGLGLIIFTTCCGVMEKIIPDTVAALRPFNIRHIITGHCTGWRALHALANEFGEVVSQSAVGTTYTFAASEAQAR